MLEEHVDGGYLVTQGVYVGVEDFNKAVVRQLMVRNNFAQHFICLLTNPDFACRSNDGWLRSGEG
jgi:hypothetical protein